MLIHIFNGKQCRSRTVGFFKSQLIWIYTVCKGRTYPGSAGLGLTLSTLRANSVYILVSFHFFSPEKRKGSDIHAKCLLRRQFAWTVKAYVLRKIRNIPKLFQNTVCWNMYPACWAFKYLNEWQTVQTLIRWLYQMQTALGLHCLHMPFYQEIWYIKL